MSTFTLAISCLTISNLPWFLDLTFQVPMLFTASDLTSITSHIHSWALFLLWLCLFNLSQHQDLCQWVDLCPIQYCSLRHWTLLPSPVTSTAGSCFHFGSVSSFFLELFLHSSPVAYWAPIDLGSSSFSDIFLPFHTVHRVLKVRILKWFAISFSSGLNSPPWLVCLGWPYMAWLIVSLN